MNDKELLQKADEFLDMAFLGDGKEQCLMYKMEARLEELTADKEPASIAWEPKKGEKYYAVNATGRAYEGVWNGSPQCQALLKHHNVYKTRDQAEKAAPHQTRHNRVLQAVLDLEPDQKVDWSDGDQIKYTVYFSHDNDAWVCWKAYGQDNGYPVLTDKKNVQPLLDRLSAKEQENG